MSSKPDPRKVLDDALQLDQNARAFVAEALIESLDMEADFIISNEWLQEIRRRSLDIDSGKVTMLDGASVIHELRGKYGK